MAVTAQRAKVIAADVKRREEHVRSKRDVFYSRCVATYSNKGMSKSSRIDSDVNNSVVRAFERGGYKHAETSSSLKVRRVEEIDGKRFKVIS